MMLKLDSTIGHREALIPEWWSTAIGATAGAVAGGATASPLPRLAMRDEPRATSNTTCKPPTGRGCHEVTSDGAVIGAFPRCSACAWGNGPEHSTADINHRARGASHRRRRLPLPLLARDHGPDPQAAHERRAGQRPWRSDEHVPKHPDVSDR